MASVLKVDKLDPQSGTALEIGTSGDTITVPSGATFAVSGTMNASSITAGTVATARLGTGTASSSTVLYGDQTYKAEPGLTGWTTGGTSNSLIPSATDQGIYLGVSSATAANLLDDYEEGTWTPTMSNYSGTPTIADASYTKIGRMVFCGLQWTTDGTSDGSEAQINGFPFTSANLTTAGTMGGGLVTQTTGNAAQRWYMSANATNAKAVDGTGNSLNYNDIGANKDMRLYFTYEAT